MDPAPNGSKGSIFSALSVGHEIPADKGKGLRDVPIFRPVRGAKSAEG